MRAARPAAILLLAAACAAPGTRFDTLASVDRLVRETGSTTVVVDDGGLTVLSPYDAGTTAALVEVVRGELAAVSGLFALDAPPPPIVHFAALAPEDPDAARVEDRLFPDRDGRAGETTTTGDRVVVYVSDLDPAVWGGPVIRLGTLRHELAHAAYFRAGHPDRAWLAEGTARVVEMMRPDGHGGLAPSPPHASFREVPELLDAHGLDALLDWRGRPDAETERDFYVMAHALAHYLITRAGSRPFAEALARAGALGRRDLRVLEPAWRAWLADLDQDRRTVSTGASAQGRPAR